MKVSFIYPTRKRFELFKKSTDSLINNCNDINNLEVLVGMDDDDVDTIELVRDYIKDKEFIKLFVTERYTYGHLNYYVNYLSKESTGEYLFLWNDDCYMESKDFDLVMDKYKDKFVVLNPLVTNHVDFCRIHSGNLFPIIPRKWIEITGRWSGSAANDTWIEMISKSTNIVVIEDDIKLYHDRYDLTKQNADEVYYDVDQYRHSIFTDFNTKERQDDLMIDKKLIAAYLNVPIRF